MLPRGRVSELKTIHGQEELADIVRPLLAVVQVCQAAEGLQVMFHMPVAIETLRHEVGATVLLQQAAVGHGDASRASHQVIGVLDSAIVLADARSFVNPDAVELDQPMFELGLNVELTCAGLVRRRKIFDVNEPK